jgi:hypothetical protein
MCSAIDLKSTIKELEEMQPELRAKGEYRKANMLDFAIGYLNKLSNLQTPKQVDQENGLCFCPTCGKGGFEWNIPRYCEHCGQPLKLGNCNKEA